MTTLVSQFSIEILKHFGELKNLAKYQINGHIIEILKLLDLIDRVRNERNEAINKYETQKNLNFQLEQEIKESKKENQNNKEHLRDARSQIESLISEKQALEIDVAEYERKFQLVSQLLKNDICNLNSEDRRKLAFLNETQKKKRSGKTHARTSRTRTTGASDIDYDKTGDSLDVPYDESDESHLRSGKVYRRSNRASVVEKTLHAVGTKRPINVANVEKHSATPSKRSKDSPEMITATTTLVVDPKGKTPSKAKVTIKRSMNRSMSESNILITNNEITEAIGKFNALTQSTCTTKSTMDLRNQRTPGKSWTNGLAIESRPHTYLNYSGIIGFTCDVCNRWFGIGGKPAYKCNDCGIRLHKSCTAGAPIPCIPRSVTPRTPSKYSKQRLRLRHFCPSTQPQIPHILIHCVVTLEKNRLDCEGIYRIPGNELQVNKLLNEFKTSRVLPKLEYHDTETITGCIKKFLRELRDSLIPSSSWEELVTAAEKNKSEDLRTSISELPDPNRDTLAYLCAHFQKVSDNYTRNKMTIEVLARSVAPTIVGPAPLKTLNMMQAAEEAKKQYNIMVALLRMPRSYWYNMYACNDESKPLIGQNDVLTFGTPSRLVDGRGHLLNSSPIVNQSILGPVRTPPSGHSELVCPMSARREKFFDPV